MPRHFHASYVLSPGSDGMAEGGSDDIQAATRIAAVSPRAPIGIFALRPNTPRRNPARRSRRRPPLVFWSFARFRRRSRHLKTTGSSAAKGAASTEGDRSRPRPRAVLREDLGLRQFGRKLKWILPAEILQTIFGQVGRGVVGCPALE